MGFLTDQFKLFNAETQITPTDNRQYQYSKKESTVISDSSNRVYAPVTTMSDNRSLILTVNSPNAVTSKKDSTSQEPSFGYAPYTGINPNLSGGSQTQKSEPNISTGLEGGIDTNKLLFFGALGVGAILLIGLLPKSK